MQESDFEFKPIIGVFMSISDNFFSRSNLKDQAKRLRDHHTKKGFSIPHSACLEAIAAIYGFKDWNTICAITQETEMINNNKILNEKHRSMKFKIAISGPSGSGKSYSALRLAKGLGDKIAVIDTENGSASFYADRFDFDVMTIDAPFTPEKYIEAIKAAEKARYDILIIDSMSHAWIAENGLYDGEIISHDYDKSSFFTNRTPLIEKHKSFEMAVLNSSLNVISTFRSRKHYVEEIVSPPNRLDAMAYGFTFIFNLDAFHNAEILKDGIGLFTNWEYKNITEEIGEKLKKVLTSREINHDPNKGIANSHISIDIF